MNIKEIIRNCCISIIIFFLTFILCLILHSIELSQSLVDMLFVLAVFLISLLTDGYVYGIIASLCAVLVCNFVFVYPYYRINFVILENCISAIVTLVVAITTCTLTIQIKLKEKLKLESEKEKMKANLLRAVSHDLRTPLTTIYGSSLALIENYDELNKEQKISLLKEVRDDSENLIKMVENLLSITRINADNVSVCKMPIVLEELIDTTLVQFNKAHPTQKVDVVIPNEFVSIPMDAILIKQVLINLLENAVIHAQGMTKLILKVTLQKENVLFEVIDNGSGIEEDRLAELFTGYLGSNHMIADANHHNMGIGLSVCATIIKAHGSTIHVQSSKHGTTFSFLLAREIIKNGK